MNRINAINRALYEGLMPLLPHPTERVYLNVKRAACGCEFKQHTGAGRLEYAAGRCPKCNDETPPTRLEWPATFASPNQSIELPNKQPAVTTPAQHPLAKFERALGDAVQDLPRPPTPPAKPSREMTSRVVWLEQQMRYALDTHTAIVGGAEERLKQQDSIIKALEAKIAAMANLFDGVLAENHLRLPPPFDPD